MCASTASQVSLQHIFFEKEHINISPFSVKTLIAWLFQQKLTISPILFGNTQRKSRSNQIKTTTAIPFGLTLFVEYERHCSYFGV